MKSRALGRLAVALVLASITMLSAMVVLSPGVTSAQVNSAGEKAPIKDAFVVLVKHDDLVSRSILQDSGSPYHVKRILDLMHSLLSVSDPYTMANSTGQFQLDSPLGSGFYNVTAFSPGYVADNAATVIVNENGTTSAANLTVAMRPSAVISGIVTDEQGRPVPGVVVSVGSPYNAANYDVTMDDGVFTLDTGLKSGTYQVYAYKPEIDISKLAFGQNTGSDLIGLASASTTGIPALSKNTTGLVSANVSASLEDGKLTTLNIKMSRSDTISGTVTDAKGNPLQGVAVFAFRDSGGRLEMVNAMAITDSAGHYLIDNDISPGNYALVVPWTFSKGYTAGQTIVDVPFGSTGIQVHAGKITLQNSGSITGKVVDENGNAVVNATVIAIPKGLWRNGSASVSSLTSYQFLAVGQASGQTDADGKFRLSGGIGTGEYVVYASFGDIIPAGNSIIVNVQSNNSTVNTPDIVLGFGVVVSIKGKVVSADGTPVENAMVMPSFAKVISGAQLLAPRTGPDGTFLMTVPLKEHTEASRSLFNEIIASADGYSTQTIRISDGQPVQITLKKAPQVSISGIVVAEAGKPGSPAIETVLTKKGTLTFEEANRTYSIGLQTNSHILNATFNQNDRQIDVLVEGVAGSAGLSQFVIPKSFLEGPFTVKLDNQTLSGSAVTVKDNQTATVVTIKYQHSMHTITIEQPTQTQSSPEFPVPAVAGAAAVLGIVLFWRLKPRKI